MICRDNKVFRFVALAAIIFMVTIASAGADEIILRNGDRITGSITSLAAGKLVITTTYANSLSILTEQVVGIRTDTPVTVKNKGGEVFIGKLKTTEAGKIAVEQADGGTPAVMDWKTVTTLNPPPVQWVGNITVSGLQQSGNTDKTGLTVSADAVRKTEKDRISARFMHNYADENKELSVQNTFAAGQYDYFITSSWFTYLSVDLLHDKFKDLKLRTVISPGLGYQVWDDQIKSLSLEAGAAHVSEDRSIAEDDQWISARLAANLKYAITAGIAFTDKLQILPSLESISNFQLRNEAALSSGLGKNWAMVLSNLYEYDSNPAENVKRDDVTWMIGLQYAF